MASPVVHFEIGCKNSEKTQEFYKQLFDWEIDPQGPAAMINTGSSTGIMGHIMALGHEPHNYITVYAQVESLEASLKRAGELGGKTLVPPQEVPGMGHFAWISDPEGTIFGLWKPLQG
jgi:predicted enzyme related to lactoylglutathione lyase